MLKIKITQTKSFKPKPKDETQLGFGKYFTDHLFLMDWDAKRGWHDARIEPYHRIRVPVYSTMVRKCLKASRHIGPRMTGFFFSDCGTTLSAFRRVPKECAFRLCCSQTSLMASRH